MQCGESCSFTGNGDNLACDSCKTTVFACTNQVHNVCHSFHDQTNRLCRWCDFTSVVPSTNDAKNVARWATAETAKRRLLVQLEELSLPPFTGDLQVSHPLTFEFKADVIGRNGKAEKIITGHEDGVITVNLAEADSVHRERVRVQLGEPQRTLIGHMRHEYGHYLDWAWACRVDAEGYKRLFGDPDLMDYSEAMHRYYADGAPADWASNHVSADATMHPWEDFAETVNVYLDIMAIATTANDVGGRELDRSANANPQTLVQSVLEIVVEVSEYNLDLGLTPLLPERFSTAVIEKLSYVHSLRSKSLASQLQTQEA